MDVNNTQCKSNFLLLSIPNCGKQPNNTAYNHLILAFTRSSNPIYHQQTSISILNNHKVMKPMQLTEKDMHQTQLEINKAVAQAWHGHTNSIIISTTAKESETCRHNKFKAKPSRFKMERLKYLLDKSANKGLDDIESSAYWDFGQSLWDSYEVVTVSKQLENGMVLERAFMKPYCRKKSVGKNGESVNSLRYLFNHMSSRRFSEPKVE